VRVGDRQELPPNVALRPMFDRYRSEHHVRLWADREELHLPRNLIGQQVIISIEELHPLSASQPEQAVACSIAALVRARFPTDATAELSDDIQTAVG
jgi:hypothetical protein